MRNREGNPPSLTVDEIARIIADQKDDLQRQANQGIRKKDWEQGIGALASMEALDTFLYNCRLRSGEFADPSPEHKREKKPEPITVRQLQKIAEAK